MNPNIIKAAIGGGVATGVALVAAPLIVGAMGFTAAGISAGSIAAKMMSAAAIANGGGVAAGSIVAVLQSIGAACKSCGLAIKKIIYRGNSIASHHTAGSAPRPAPQVPTEAELNTADLQSVMGFLSQK